MLTSLTNNQLSKGGTISFRQGFYAETTAWNLNGHSGYVISGAGNSGFGENPAGTQANGAGTLLVAKTTGMALIESAASPGWAPLGQTNGTVPVARTTIENMGLNGNGIAAFGINFASNEVGFADDVFQNLIFGCTENGPCFTTTPLNMDGLEDAFVSYVDIYNTCCSAVTTPDMHWKVPLGNIEIADSMFADYSISLNAQVISIIRTTLNGITLLAPQPTVQVLSVQLTSDYLNNLAGGFILNGNTVGSINIQAGTVRLGTVNTVTGGVLITGPGTVFTWSTCAASWQFDATSTYTSGAPTIGNPISCGNNHKFSGTPPVGFPFTPNGNNVF